ncbi:glycoside hydrolase family 43 protein [Bifidobacterium phasiani]|uniref:Glycoside hydrolase family 43 protein n=1 Tax=Bifidobacterium phasiani TaxID=2834431 RepID=A0ABS6W6C1_9BIFI|nr:glycoside hydrolase family 43 protein [Bifidobacterium phasiani]MBW3082038.1 glycoside hydrolase family 43 protein [Bifidobacterium phasiani]
MTTPSILRRAAAGIAAAALLFGALAGCSGGGTQGADDGADTAEISRVSSHDPSIVKDGDTYYIFGSHRAWAKSTDLVNWETFENNLSTDYETILGDIWEEWSKQSTNPDVEGNMWAPDVVWNDTMGKWCMYLSVNGDNYRSVIVLLTADDIEGDWTYVGPVVYSGFEKVNVSRTDVERVLGEDADLTRYQSQRDTGINAIDPCVKTDENGDMWMTFGSWFGGMWMLRLDPATGLRDYSVTYETVADQSDAYYGVKLAGGYGNSGEGSYLLHTNGYWYLFASYGNLQQTGGYQVRMFRSENITGPYVDQAGNTAISYRAIGNNWQSENGIRLMSSIQWSGNDNGDIEVAQGHNSALVDDDGTAYIVYHTRFSDRGEEHEVRVRELMPTADGWLVAAPYEYTGTKAETAGYDAAELAGDYELVVHEQSTSFKGPKKVTDTDSTDYRGVNKPVDITLNEDGTVSGDRTGTWEAAEGSNQMTITLDGVDYTGDFIRMPREVDGKEVMAFSALGDNLCIWGSQV